MDFFSKGLEALRGDYHQPQTADDTINKLCDRLATATLLEDRRAAVLSLKDYRDVGGKALPHLIETLKSEQVDVELTRALVETLYNLCLSSPSDNPPDLSISFTDEIVKDISSIGAVLDALQDNDFYVRYTSLQLLNTLLHNRAERLQECVLASAMGISRLMDMLGEHREVIRNEALLLLIALTEVNADIQKIVVFENAFDRLLAIVMQEGGIQGGIVVQDCLQLVHNLLRYNVSNQNYFRETGGIQKAASLLKIPTNMPAEAWDNQMAINISMAIALLRILVNSNNANVNTNQKMMHQCGVLMSITQLAFAKDLPDLVRAEAFYTLGDVIRGNDQNRETFCKLICGDATNTLTYGAQMFAIAAIGQTGLVDCRTRLAAAYAFECYLNRNEEGQKAVGDVLIPAPGSPKDPVGNILVMGVADWEKSQNDPYVAWFSALIWSRVLDSNDGAKQAALNLTSGDTEQGEEPVPFMHSVMHSVIMSIQDGLDLRIPVSLMALLCTWLYEHPASVTQFLSEGVHLQSLIEWISQSTGMNEIIQGMAAYLLGIIYEYDDDAQSPFPRQNIHSIVIGRIGLDLFISRITRFRETSRFQETPRTLWIPAITEHDNPREDILLDPAFVHFFRGNYDVILHSVTSDPSAPRSSRNKNQQQQQQGGDSKETIALLGQLNTTIDEQRGDIVTLKQRIKELELQLITQKEQHEQQQATTMVADTSDETKQLQEQLKQLQLDNAQLLEQKTENEQKFKDLEKEQEDLLVFLADQDEKIKTMKIRLRELGEDIPASDEEEEEEEEEEA
ncbi:p115 like vesicle tethering protein [Syncephalis fuscata]|nr:p115 like vesicle tethering protein [Syncephalis fuscata]